MAFLNGTVLTNEALGYYTVEIRLQDFSWKMNLFVIEAYIIVCLYNIFLFYTAVW